MYHTTYETFNIMYIEKKKVGRSPMYPELRALAIVCFIEQ